MGTISKNFSYREFEASETADLHNICNVITEFNVRDAVRALVLEILQPLRDSLGEPIYINSGFRCRELNALVGGTEDSQHRKGEAADIRTMGDDPLRLARQIINLKLPFDQLILYPTFVHVSHRLNGNQRGRILYNYRWRGEKPW